MYLEGSKYRDTESNDIYELVGDESKLSGYLFIKNLDSGKITPCPEEIFVKIMERD